MSGRAQQLPCIVNGETRVGRISFDGKLETGESLTGSPTITDITGDSPSDLTIGDETISTATLEILGVDISAGRALTFSVTGQQADKEYELSVSCGTDATPAQTLKGFIKFLGV